MRDWIIGILTVFMKTVYLYSAGTYGVVSVEWFVNSALTTAVRGVDYVGDGATLTFQPRERLKGLRFDDFVVICFVRDSLDGAIVYFCYYKHSYAAEQCIRTVSYWPASDLDWPLCHCAMAQPSHPLRRTQAPSSKKNNTPLQKDMIHLEWRP